MRVAAISDIHGNLFALEAVLEDIARHDADMVLNLGDNLAGPMDPRGVCDLLMGADFPSVRGNHDRVLVMPKPGKEYGPIDAFAQEQLELPQLTWLSQLPETLSVPEIFLCHGTPQSDAAPWLDRFWSGRTATYPDHDEVAALADGLDFPVMLCGHTHLSRVVRLRDDRMVVNPGSVGVQFNHGAPDARYALLERRPGGWTASLRSVPYDHEAAARQAEANGFPGWRLALTTGWVGPEGLFSTPRAG